MPNQTGPTSITGRFVSSQNSFRHGCCSESLFVKGENPSEFFLLLEDAFQQHQPAFEQDAILVTRSVRANWILLRRERIYDRHESMVLELKEYGDLLVPKFDLPEFDLYDRYVTQAARRFHRALKDIQLIQKMSRDTERWRIFLEKQKEEILADPATAAFLASLDEAENAAMDEAPEIVEQSVFAAFDKDGDALAYESTPANEEITQLPVPPQKVVRTYHLKGIVPAKLHWLFTNDKQKRLTYQEIRKELTFAEWQTAIAGEE